MIIDAFRPLLPRYDYKETSLQFLHGLTNLLNKDYRSKSIISFSGMHDDITGVDAEHINNLIHEFVLQRDLTDVNPDNCVLPISFLRLVYSGKHKLETSIANEYFSDRILNLTSAFSGWSEGIEKPFPYEFELKLVVEDMLRRSPVVNFIRASWVYNPKQDPLSDLYDETYFLPEARYPEGLEPGERLERESYPMGYLYDMTKHKYGLVNRASSLKQNMISMIGTHLRSMPEHNPKSFESLSQNDWYNLVAQITPSLRNES